MNYRRESVCIRGEKKDVDSRSPIGVEDKLRKNDREGAQPCAPKKERKGFG